VFQFNPIEYGPEGGPPGKDWSGCNCPVVGCRSYSNDASLLLPGTAMTGNYRITGPAGQSDERVTGPGLFAVTGLADGTNVRVKVSDTGTVDGAGGVPDAGPGEIFEFAVDRGEVVLVTGTPDSDLSGTLVNAAGPVQVISGTPCQYVPEDTVACDHMEETVQPAETLGRRYFVTVPTNPRGVAIGHVVRIYGNWDDTHLEYPWGAPSGAPAVINAGEVHDLGIVDIDFEVVSPDHDFAVTSFQLGCGISDPGHPLDCLGDPAQSNAQAVEQYRTRYVFLAPDDYDVSYADVVVPDGADVWLDGTAIGTTPSPIGIGYGIMRILLDYGRDGAHILEANQPVGLQVMGYGSATSYQYPGGLNLTRITDPPLI
jgi:hypothetical protein